MRVTPSPLVGRMSGKTAGLVAATWKGRQYVRAHVIPANPQTAAQTLVRTSLARCVTLWRSLEADFKTWLDEYATGYRMSGFNTFMQKNRAVEQAGTALAPVPAHPNCAAPEALAFVTGVGAGGTIDLTWTDNSPTAFNQLRVCLRLDGGNIFTDFKTFQADAETGIIPGLTAGEDYDCYGFYVDSVEVEYGTSDSDLAITAKA